MELENAGGGTIEITETVDGKSIEESASLKTRKKKAGVQERKSSDGYLWAIYLVILMFSIVELYSASSSEVTSKSLYGPLINHAKYLLLGLGIIYVFQRMHYRVFMRWAWFATIVCAGLVVLSNHVGMNINGAQRALALPGGFTIQPPEIAKLAVVLALARIMAKHQKSGGVSTRGVVESAVVVAIFAGLLWRNGLTNTLILMLVSIAMFIIGGVEWRKVFLVVGVYSICAGGVMLVNKLDKAHSEDEFAQIGAIEQVKTDPNEVDRTDLRNNRLAAFIQGVQPTDKLTDDNRQVFFSNIAMAHGGVIGNGPGSSRESARLPLAFSDYIFSIIIEDIGFIGGIVLLIVYLMFALRSGTIAGRLYRAFPAFLIMGCSVLIVVQALVHMAIATGLGPVSGQPLPFISKGGTSIIVMSAALGMMLSVSRYAVRNKKDNNGKNLKKDVRNELEGLPTSIRTANPMQFDQTITR